MVPAGTATKMPRVGEKCKRPEREARPGRHDVPRHVADDPVSTLVVELDT